MKVLKKAFDIIEFTVAEPRGAGEIAAYLELPRPTCSRLLKLLLDAGYLKKTLDNKKYAPGPMGFQVFTAESDYLAIRQAAKAPIETLAKTCNGNALISIIEESYRYIIFMHNASTTIKSIILLRHSDFYLSISGRVHTAYASQYERDKIIKRLGYPGNDWNNISDDKQFEQELKKIRKHKINQLLLQEKYLTFATPINLSGKTAVIGLVIDRTEDTDTLDMVQSNLLTAASDIEQHPNQDIIIP